MITEEDVNQLQTNISQGRGLWVGLFTRQHPDDEVGRAKHPLVNWMKADAHVTLLHLGKSTDRSARDLLGQVVLAASVLKFPMQAEITGVGCFWRRNSQTLIALVNSAGVCEARNVISLALTRHGFYRDDRYGFIPHITLNDGSPVALLSTPYSATSTNSGHTMATAQSVPIVFPDLHVVCGDARIKINEAN